MPATATIPCWFCLRFWCYGEYAEFEWPEVVDLPFVPAKGQQFIFTEDGLHADMLIASAAWSVPQECFWVEFEISAEKEDEATPPNLRCGCEPGPQNKCCKNMSYWRDVFKEYGWKER